MRETTPTRNVDVVRALFDAVNRHDREGILRCLDRDVIYAMGAGQEQWAIPELGEPAHGHAEILAFYERTWTVIEDLRAEPLELLEDGNQVTATLAVSARIARTELVGRWRDRHVCTMRDGKIVHYEIWTERGQGHQTLE